MCSGALLIAAMGHLNGLSATTYPTAFKELRELGVEVVEDYHWWHTAMLPQQPGVWQRLI